MYIIFLHYILIYYTKACFHFLSSELWHLLKKCGSTNSKSKKDIQVTRIIIIPRIIFSVITNKYAIVGQGQRDMKTLCDFVL